MIQYVKFERFCCISYLEWSFIWPDHLFRVYFWKINTCVCTVYSLQNTFKVEFGNISLDCHLWTSSQICKGFLVGLYRGRLITVQLSLNGHLYKMDTWCCSLNAVFVFFSHLLYIWTIYKLDTSWGQTADACPEGVCLKESWLMYIKGKVRWGGGES